MSIKTIKLDTEQIRLLTNYAHWIPMSNGNTQEFMQETYPGWVWNDLIPKLLKNGLITLKPLEGDVMLCQGLWLKSGINFIIANKNGRKVTFEILRA